MRVLTTDVLRPVPVSARLAGYWGGQDVDAVAALVSGGLGVVDTVLPLTRMDGRTVYPIVRIDAAAIAQRQARWLGPILDRGWLRALALDGCVDAPPPAVTMAGFLTVDPFPAVRSVLGGFSGWARVIAALPAGTKLPAMQATACDYYGYTVVAADLAGGTAQVVVPGHPGAAPGSATVRDPWQLLREEQLFDLAVSTGVIDWR